MPSSILARFKRSPSESSTLVADEKLSLPNKSPFRRSISPFKPTSEGIEIGQQPTYIESPISPTSHGKSDSGSHFVEEFDENQRGLDLVDGHGSGRARGQTLPALGTPKLVLTADGESSPVSFGSSHHSDRASSLLGPGIRRQPSKERLGLGIGTVSEVSLR